MPSLDSVVLEAMLKVSRPCPGCGAKLRRNYCVDHDEFFWDCHVSGCAQEAAHRDHTTYRAVLDCEYNGGRHPYAEAKAQHFPHCAQK